MKEAPKRHQHVHTLKCRITRELECKARSGSDMKHSVTHYQLQSAGFYSQAQWLCPYQI